MKRLSALGLVLCFLGGLACGGVSGGGAEPAPTPAGGARSDDGAKVGDDSSIAAAIPSGWEHSLEGESVTGERGMIATDAAIATRIGHDVLEGGGNAIDAAVATAFALAVVYPQAGNIGGGGFLVYRGADGTRAALDFRETAPAGATRNMYIDPDSGEVTDASLTGALAAGVPGSVAGLWKAHQRFGSTPWKELLAPAIGLARDGFEVPEPVAERLADRQDRVSRFPATRELYYSEGEPPEAGEHFANPDLAAVLERIAESGPAGFYQGETAGRIVAEMERSGGLITAEDLAGYEARWRDPVVFSYRGHEVVSMPPPSSGGLVLALMANMLSGDELGALPWHGPKQLHLLVEAMRRGFALRNRHLGDPDFVDIPREEFQSAEVADRLRSSVRADRATPSSEVSGELGASREGRNTTHFSIVDAGGNAVALTTTINTAFGSGVVVGGAGFFLNNEMDDFAAKPGEPNVFGLVQGEANAIEPGKRPLSSMSPTVVVDPDGRVKLVTGAAGGPTIITGSFQILVNVLDHGMDARAAVFAPRVHHQHLPDVVLYEPNGLPEQTIEALGALGHETRGVTRFTLADAPSIVRQGGVWHGAREPRQEGSLALGL